MAELADRKRSGRPRSFSAAVVTEVKAMACEPPQDRQVPLSRWSSTELARQAVAEGLVETVSASTVRRWLAADAIRPWRYRSWIFRRDPEFATKAGRVLDLYERVWDGVELSADDYVISADEKSQLQAVSRCHPELAAAPACEEPLSTTQNTRRADAYGSWLITWSTSSVNGAMPVVGATVRSGARGARRSRRGRPA